MLRPTYHKPRSNPRLPILLSLVAVLLLTLLLLHRLFPQIFVPRSAREIVEEPYPNAPVVPMESTREQIAPSIALVIDDLGNRWDNDVVRGLLTLNVPLTLGVIPGLEYSDRIAKAAHDHGETVIAHVPMKALHMSVGLGVPVINPDASRADVLDAMAPAMRLPYAIGMNNHMGSAATQDAETMRLVAQFCRAKGWFILDSITHASSVLYFVALQEGVPAARRDIFLDHEKGVSSIETELAEAERMARTLSRPIVVIGHPRPETWEVLQRDIPEMLRRGVHFVPLTDALHTTNGKERASGKAGRP